MGDFRKSPRGSPLFLVCSISAVASCARLRMTKTTDDDNEDDDDDKGRRRRSEREKPKLILLCFSPPHRYLLPLFHPPSSSTQSLRVRGGPLIHRKVGQPGVAAPIKMNYDVGGPWSIPYWRRSHLSFRQLLHASLSSLPCPACEPDIVIIAPRLVVANGGLHATCALRSIHFIIRTQHTHTHAKRFSAIFKKRTR